jgi:hypothetical protein
LLSKEDAINNTLIPNKRVIVFDYLPSRSPFLNPPKKEYESEDRPFYRLLKVIDLLHLDPLHPKILKQESEQAYNQLQTNKPHISNIHIIIIIIIIIRSSPESLIFVESNTTDKLDTTHPPNTLYKDNNK